MSWVEDERQALAASFRAADPDAATLCAGWTARHLCAHLVQRDHAALGNVWDQLTTRSPGEERFMGRLVDAARTPEGYAALVDRFAAGPGRHSLMRRFDAGFNLVEYAIHHEDLRRGSGPVPPRELPAGESEELWRRARLILRTGYRKSPVGVILAPVAGAALRVKNGPRTVTFTGSPLELVLHAAGRRAAADVKVEGAAQHMKSFTDWAAQG